MTTRNENLARADVTIAQLDTNGGLLGPEQSNAFIDLILDQPTILPQARVIRMAKPEVQIDRMGFDSRILRAARNGSTQTAEDDGSNGRYVRKADRAAPTTSQITLTSKELIAEVRLPYEVLEDNIEGASMEAHVMRQIAERAALDLEEWFLWADTNSGDAMMALTDGIMKKATSHVADNLGAGVSPDLFENAMLALPQKYLRNLPQLRGFVSMANTLRYRSKVAKRQTGYGDAALQSGDLPLAAYGLKIEGAPMLAADGIGSSGLMTFPKNLIWGIRREISVETDKDIRSREYIIVLTLRAGIQIDDADAVVKLENI